MRQKSAKISHKRFLHTPKNFEPPENSQPIRPQPPQYQSSLSLFTESACTRRAVDFRFALQPSYQPLWPIRESLWLFIYTSKDLNNKEKKHGNMAESTLQDRLREHSKAFDGLLSLIPAKMYYGEDNSEQWKRTKQTKAEAKAAKTAKLDPDSELNRNAKEVMDERAARNKRKLEAMQEEEDKEDDDDQPIPGVQRELPGQGLRNKDYKKQKMADLPIDTIDDANPAEMSQNQLMRMAKKEAKLEKRATKKAKKAEKKAAKLEAGGGDAAATVASAVAQTPEAKESSKPADTKIAKSPSAKKESKKQQKKAESKDAKPVTNDHDRDDKDEEYETVDEDEDEAQAATTADLNPLDISGLDNQKPTESSGASSPTSAPASPTFDTAATTTTAGASGSASTTTSTSSTVPPSEKPKHIKLPADTSALRARLAARIEALRAARKADGPDGKPIRTRQELIEARRFKQAQRKEHKKELRTKARLEEDARREETLASNSPSVMSPRVGLGGDDGDEEPANFAFGRVAFDDGTKLSHDLSHALNTHKKRGPSDPKTALIKIQNQKKRLAALDKEKQADIAEKEQWLIARKRAEGERVRDDEQALKKAVKRKDQAKKKSEKAWKERSDGVAKSIRDKQKKREDNIKKRKDDKLAHKLGRKSGKKVGGGGAKKTKARPGFEGSFGGGKKKK
ncbi:surfeit locus protein 6 [Colletotrichum orchidophilum]|uniref:Surfeit locus protein 6 n=1 Tax=Colletotrichum orchidophilum TaxID=1209926 RepID=A0A1G4BSN3_9PEZI|nr:surfeit locus protein 6 [Colletotrichum orchidophilum]OHF04444.1 surfeit locus protein 6 [Colletotrichum orchidophilum]